VQQVFCPVHSIPLGAQSVSIRHRTQDPSPLHFGVDELRAAHWASLPQAEQTKVVVEQMGAVALVQLVLVRQPAQAPVPVRQ
jgi:hypothetical protein